MLHPLYSVASMRSFSAVNPVIRESMDNNWLQASASQLIENPVNSKFNRHLLEEIRIALNEFWVNSTTKVV